MSELAWDASILIAVVAGLWWFIWRPYRKSQAKLKLQVEQQQTEHAVAVAAKKKESERRQRIRDNSAASDELLSRIIRAKIELDAIISSGDLFFKLDSVEQLLGWKQTHSALMSFGPFSAVVDELSEAQGHVLIKEDIEEALDDDNFIGNAVDYADAQFMIERQWQLVDGVNRNGEWEGGREMEMANGQYEYDHVRYNRLLLSVPGADRGWIYILTNSAMDGLVKIGFSKKDPKHRATELSKDTGVPAEFAVAYCEIVGNCRRVEAVTHERLAHCRVSHNREFFRVTVEDAINVISLVVRDFS